VLAPAAADWWAPREDGGEYWGEDGGGPAAAAWRRRRRGARGVVTVVRGGAQPGCSIARVIGTSVRMRRRGCTCVPTPRCAGLFNCRVDDYNHATRFRQLTQNYATLSHQRTQ